MRKINLLVLTVFCYCTSFSQLTLTATNTPAPATYPTLTAAFNAINNGVHTGVISISINGTTTEPGTALLNASGGGSSYSSISIKPTGGVASFITGNVAGPLIDLDGADNVVVDGLNADNNSLTISNTSNGSAAITVRFINDAKSNKFQNLTILGSTTGAANATIYFSTGNATGNTNNKISNCNISEATGNFPTNAFFSVGTTVLGQENALDTIANCNISNYFNPETGTSAITLSGGNSEWNISDNKFFQTFARTFTAANTHRIIYITSGTNYLISRNTIGYGTSSLTGTYTLGGNVASRFVGIDIASGTTGTSSIQGNKISDISFTSSSGVSTSTGIWCGINIAGGNVNVGGSGINQIGRNLNGAITITPTVAGPLVVGILSSSTGIVNIQLNLIQGIDIIPTGSLSATFNAIQTAGSSGTITVTENFIGDENPGSIKIGGPTTNGSGIIRGILNSNLGSVTISENDIKNLVHNSSSQLGLFRAIELQQGTGTISSNRISKVSSNGTSVSVATQEGAGILITSSLTGILVMRNTISDLSVTNSSTSSGTVLSGIYLGSTTNGITVLANRIYGLSNASTSTSTTAPGVAAGIYCRDANIANPMLIANNMISLGNAQTTNTAFIGIWSQLATAQNYQAKIFYNSINIEGTAASGAQPSFCYYRGDFAASSTVPNVEIKNNIFTNSRTGGTGKHYAIANGYGNATSSSTGWAANVSDYNVLNANPATIGYWSGDRDIAGWRTASAGDANSLSGIAVNYTNSPTDLHLVPNNNSAVDGKAVPIPGVTKDFDDQNRNAATPDIGADEFTPGPIPIRVEYFKAGKQGNANILDWRASCTSTSVRFEIQNSRDGREFTAITSFSATQARCAQPFDFLHTQPQPGLNYYRLKMTEIDGQVSYSQIVLVINKESGFEILGLHPNVISNGRATLNMSSAKATIIELIISAVNGSIVERKTVPVMQGSNALEVNVSALTAGYYNLSYVTDGEMNTLRFVVIK